MSNSNLKIDDYINQAKPFAQPVLKHIRELVHEICEEKIRWGFPHFDYEGILLSMAAFKTHCAINFWMGGMMEDKYKLLNTKSEKSMGQFGRIESLDELPPDSVLKYYISQAVKLNIENIKRPVPKPNTHKKSLDIPDYFHHALLKNPEAMDNFTNFSYSNKKDYIEWIVDAKTEKTRNSRIDTAIGWISEGKVRNWKYIKK